MLEGLIGWFAKSLCLFTRGFKSPFFLIMLLKFHLNEIKYRLMYILIAFIITYIIIINNSDYIILIFTPNIKTFMMYSNIIDGILLKWSISLYLSFFFIFPYIVFSLWSFIRPGLIKKEDINPFLIISLLWSFPIIIYFTILAIYNYYLIEISDINNISAMQRFLPTLLQIKSLISNLIIFSVLFTILFLATLFFNIINISIYINYRFHILFLISILLTLLIPPDLLVLILSSFFILLILELFLFTIFIFKNYSLYRPIKT